jgi:hypothetical protein
VVVAEFFSKSVEFGEKDFLEAYPHIQELVDRVQNEPAIKKVLTIFFQINLTYFISSTLKSDHQPCFKRAILIILLNLWIILFIIN